MSGIPRSTRIKAALLSGLIFPGSGHFLLQRKARGCLFALPALVALVLLLRQIMERMDQVMDQINSGALPLDVQLITEKVTALTASDGTFMSVTSGVLLVCWLGSIIDTFLIQP